MHFSDHDIILCIFGTSIKGEQQVPFTNLLEMVIINRAGTESRLAEVPQDPTQGAKLLGSLWHFRCPSSHFPAVQSSTPQKIK